MLADAVTKPGFRPETRAAALGAISAAEQCKKAGSRIGIADAQAFSSAAKRARTIITGASRDAIIHAAQTIRETVGL